MAIRVERPILRPHTQTEQQRSPRLPHIAEIFKREKPTIQVGEITYPVTTTRRSDGTFRIFVGDPISDMERTACTYRAEGHQLMEVPRSEHEVSGSAGLVEYKKEGNRYVITAIGAEEFDRWTGVEAALVGVVEQRAARGLRFGKRTVEIRLHRILDAKRRMFKDLGYEQVEETITITRRPMYGRPVEEAITNPAYIKLSKEIKKEKKKE